MPHYGDEKTVQLERVFLSGGEKNQTVSKNGRESYTKLIARPEVPLCRILHAKCRIALPNGHVAVSSSMKWFSMLVSSFQPRENSSFWC